MGEEVKPRKSRRRQRQRSRKKKGIVTIESIIPGRAPLGFSHPSPKSVYLQNVDTNAVVHAESSLKVNSHSISHSPKPVFESSLESDGVGISLPRPTLDRFATVDFSSPSSQGHHSGVRLSVSTASIAQVQSILKSARSDRPTSPLSMKRRTRSTLSGGPETRIYASPSIDFAGGELNSLEDLASSRPVPLSALGSRANPRNKGQKSWKPFLLDDDDDDEVKGVGSSPSIPEADRSKLHFRLLESIKEDDAGSAYLSKQEHDSENIKGTKGQAHRQDVDTQMQQNPLTFFGEIKSPFHNPPGLQQNLSNSPFLTGPYHLHGSYSEWSASAYPGSGVAQSGFYHQEYVHENCYVPESSYQSYSSSFEPTYTASPHKPALHQHHGAEGTNLLQYAPVSKFPSSKPEHYSRDCTPLRSESAFQYHHGGAPSLPVKSAPAKALPQMRMEVGSPAQASGLTRASDDSPQAMRLTKSNTQKQVTAFLNSVVEASNSQVKQRALNDPFLEKKTQAKNPFDRSSKIVNSPSSHGSFYASSDGSGKRITITRRGDAANESFTLNLDEMATTVIGPKHTNATKKDTKQKQLCDTPKKPSVSPSTFKERAATSKAPKLPPGLPRPPPGLSRPQMHNMMTGSVSLYTRLEEAERWFHTDSRGEDQLRQQITAIARDHAQKSSSSKGEIAYVEQVNSLLGNVIANLQTYTSKPRTEEGEPFANFGTVHHRYYESSHGGRRSYFDRDPSGDNWRLPSGRPFLNPSNQFNAKLVLDRLYRP